jgi:hypothetical protein
MILENSIDAVLRMLAITVLVDDHVHPKEPFEFDIQVRNLNIFVQGNRLGDIECDFEVWFVAHGKEIALALKGKSKACYIDEALRLITNSTLQLMLYSSMGHIIRCDNEVHDSEKELLQLAAKSWQLN